MADMSNGAVVASSSSEVESLGKAYEVALERIRKVKDSELLAINLDIPAAVTTVVGSLLEIRQLRSDLEKMLPAKGLTKRRSRV